MLSLFHARTAPLSLLCLISSVCAQITIDLTQQVVNDTHITTRPGDYSDLQRRQAGDVLTAVATNRFNSYTAAVGIGEPPTSYKLLIDTGSSNTWIRNYTLTATSIPLNEDASVSYGIGEFSGRQYLDTVHVAGGVSQNQSVSRALKQEHYDDVDGVLAFGPTNLTEFTVTNTPLVPTVIDNLHGQGAIPARVLGISFVPTTSVSDNETLNNGRLTLGGVDPESFLGEIIYLPITERYPSSMYWGLDCEDMVYRNVEGKSFHLTSEPALRSGIIDTGTTLIQIPSDALRRYMAQLPGSLVNDAGFLQIPEATVPLMGNFTFNFSGHLFPLSPSAQLFPPEVAEKFGQSAPGFVYSVFGSSGTHNTGLDFTLGMMFLERFYSVYDTDLHRIGLAETLYTHQHTSERASFRKAKRAHNVRAQKSLKTSSKSSSKAKAIKAESTGAAGSGKKRRLGALRGLSPFVAADKSVIVAAV